MWLIASFLLSLKVIYKIVEYSYYWEDKSIAVFSNAHGFGYHYSQKQVKIYITRLVRDALGFRYDRFTDASMQSVL